MLAPHRGRHDFPPPIPDDSRPDVTSPSRFLFWLIRSYGWVVPAMTAAASTWLIPAALTPWLLGRAIDSGISDGLASSSGWVAALLAVIVVGVAGGIAFHTLAVRMWLLGVYGTLRRVSRQAVGLGHVLNRRVPTGEVLSVSTSDADQFGATIDSFGQAVAAAVSFLLASALMLATSPVLGVVVLVAVPLLMLASAPVLKPLTRAQEDERTEGSTLTSQATDIATGLRILRGVGGERTFAGNYERQSQKVRALGVRLGTWQAAVEAISILLSGLLLVALVYLGALQLLAGSLSVGQLISFFGYAVFLVSPMQTFFDFAQKWVQGLVSASKASALLGAETPWKPSKIGLGHSPVLRDELSGVEVHPASMLGVVSADPDDGAALADRLGRYLPEGAPEVREDAHLGRRAKRHARKERLAARRRLARADSETATLAWGVSADGIDYARLDIADLRRRVVVAHTGALLFSGTLQSAVDPWGNHTREQAERAMVTASAEDVYASLANGWQGRIDEKGRGLSGGQRQRIILARVLLQDPDVLVLVEPTSAVDAHTEARIADRLAEHRAGRSTVVMTSSPLLLRRCDEVSVLVGGREVARGSHDELRHHPDYRRVIARGMGDPNE